MNLFDNKSHVFLFLAFIVLYEMSYTKGRPIITNQTRIKRIVGGSEVEYGYSPYLVLILAEIPSNYFWGIYWGTKKSNCGASLIHRRWLLTAAHCLSKDNEIVHPNYWQAKLGDVSMAGTYVSYFKGLLSKYLYKPEWAEYYVRVQGIYLHPTYSENTYYKNDVALMKLASPVNLDLPLDKFDSLLDKVTNFNPKIKTARDIPPKRIGIITMLPRKLDEFTKYVPKGCMLKGWGCRSYDGATSDLAHEINMTVVSNNVCDYHWGSITDTRVCAAAAIKYEGACPGDSGSPLTCWVNDVHYQLGITSFKSSVNNVDVPVVFTKVSAYRSWIDFTIQSG